MDEIRDQILSTLSSIEVENNIKIPIAVESGSRAWGFASPDSDYDCRFIYVRPTDDYLTVFSRKDTIEFAPDAVYDIGGWDVRKVITQLVKSNAVMLEWLRSRVVYRDHDEMRRELWQLGQDFFNPVSACWHYLSMAKNKLNELLPANQCKLKTYCYILRPLAAVQYIRAHGGIPFMEYRRNLEAVEVPPNVRAEVEQLLRQKESSLESDTVKPNHTLINYFKTECERLEDWLATVHFEKNRKYAAADDCFRRIVRIVWP